MRIQSLHLLAFGSFTDKLIDLSAGKEGLHIVYGANESGKSTALRALKQALYGIPAKSTDDFLHSYPDMKIGLTLKHTDGTVIKILRRKGNTKTLRNLDNESELVQESSLQQFIGNTGASMFEAMFGINHAGLVTGGQSLVNGSGEIGELLFSAGSGIADLRKIEEKLCKDYEELFTKTATNRTINKALSELAEQKRKLKDAELPSAEWEKHDQELRLAQKQKLEIDQSILLLDRQIVKLRRVKDALPLIAERNVCQEALAPMIQATLLPEDFQEISRKLLDDFLSARRTKGQATDKIAKLEEDIRSIHIPDGLLELSSVIDSLVDDAGSHKKAIVDRTGLVTDVSERQDKAKLCLKTLGLSDNLTKVEEYRLKVRDRTRIIELANEHSGVTQATKTSKKEREGLEAKIKSAHDRLASMTEPAYPESLIRTLRKIEQHGQLEEKLRTESFKLERYLKEFVIELKKLNLPDNNRLNDSLPVSDIISAFERISVPSPEVQEHFRRELQQLFDERKANKSRTEDQKSELQKCNSLLTQAETEMMVPSESDLSALRTRREQGWKLILRSWKNGESPEDEIKRYLAESESATGLQEAYEKSVSGADNIADRLRREAERVANKANLVSQKIQRESQLAELEAEKAELDATRTLLLKQWQESWDKSGYKPANISEADAWFDQYKTVENLSVNLKDLDFSVRDLNSLIRSLRETLSESLNEHSNPIQTTDHSLSQLIDLAHSMIDQLSERRKSYEQLQREIQVLDVDVAAIKEREKADDAVFASWCKNWETALKPLTLTAETSPREVISFVNELEELFKHIDEARDCQRRIDAIDRDSDKFKTDVHDLVSRVAQDLLQHPPLQAVAELKSRLISTKESKSRLAVIKKQLDEEKNLLENSGKEIERLSDELNILCKEADVQVPEELIRAAQNSNLRRKLEAEINTINRQLARLCPEETVDSFVKDCFSINRDTIDSDLAELTHKRSSLTTTQEALILAIGKETKTLEDMNGNANAADIADRIQELQSHIGSTAEQYARLKLASAVLKQAIERYREKNQSPILKRASNIFSDLTLGSFSGLLEDLSSDGQAVLRGIRANSKSTVDLSGMSEGTCDQLFLALRLASLSLFIEQEEPIPLVLDDILVNFDDERSAATLKVLSTLSKTTQIILFTHHAHMLELAKKSLKKDVLFIHHLREEQRQLVLEEALA